MAPNSQTKGNNKPVEEPRIYYGDDLISMYTAFKEQVYNPKSALYPSCGLDASPAKVFDNVTFVDIEDGNNGCIKALRETGLEAYKQDIRDYKPREEHDLLILLNPATPTEWAARHLKSGGYIIANDWHHSATELQSQPELYTLDSTINFLEKDRRKKDYRVTISRNLEGLFEPVKDAEEFKRLRPSDYKFLSSIVNSFAQDGIIPIYPNASFDEKWAAYRESTKEGMPFKRVAERYIFIKK
jgi:hypothetical protein